MKKLISLTLALAMVLALLPTTVFAATEDNLWEGKSAVFVGDSITYGSKTKKVYYQYLKESMGLKSATSMSVSGASISATSDYGHTKQPLIDTYLNIPAADLIVVFLGTNDYGHESPLGTMADTTDVSFYGALNVIIPGMQAAYPSSKIVFVTPIHRYGFGSSKITGVAFTHDSTPNGHDATLGDYAAALKVACAAYGVDVIDLYEEYPLDPSDAAVRSQYMTDGLHPNADGHKMMADIMEEHIRTYTPVETEPVEPEPETELIYGNKFASGYSQQNRASSRYNLYLPAGTKITFKHTDTMQWACAKTGSETSTNNLGYFPDSAWSNKETATVAADAWVGFTFRYRDESQVYDLTLPLSYYVTIVVPHDHAYDHVYDGDCNVCGELREVSTPMAFGGNSVSEDVSGLAFRFDVTVEGMATKGTTAIYDNATVDGYRLISMGAVVTNGVSTTDIVAVNLCELGDTTASFAVRIINIPTDKYDVAVTATPYIILEIDGIATIIYGEAQTRSYNDVVN